LYKKILVSIDDSERSFNALEYAARLAKASGAALSVLHVIKPVASSSGTESAEGKGGAETSARLAALREKIERRLPGAMPENGLVVRQGKNIANIITMTADELECDLIVLGSRRLPGARSLIAHSVTSAVISLRKKPVLIV
jgi:nucleotide-binding universal stress UspA family protein